MKQFITKSLPDLSQRAVEKISTDSNIEKTVGLVDQAVRIMCQKDFDSGNDVMNASRGPMRFGLWVLFVVFGIFGLWSACAPLKTAAVAPGSVALDSNKKTIQHLEGGIIKDILVKEGDFVKAGQPLILLDETNAKARYDIVLSQMRAFRANEQRLIAERDSLEKPDFDIPLLKDKDNPDIATIINTQNRMFESRQQAVEGEINVLQQKIKQAQEEIGGLQAQEAAARKQLSYLNEEIATVQKLVEKGQALRPRLLALQRAASDIAGRQGEYSANIARAKQSITEAEVQIINVKNNRQNEVAKELRDVQTQIADFQERLKAAEDVFNRIAIVAPQAGEVTGLMFHTKGGVIQPGVPIMDIVPQDDKLIIEARVSPLDIDVVHTGLPARIRLSAYKTRRVPTLDGEVVTVSADRFVDKATNIPYYLARVEIDNDELKELHEVDLYPGMPADVLIVTGQRTLLSYLLNPIGDSFFRAFREQ